MPQTQEESQSESRDRGSIRPGAGLHALIRREAEKRHQTQEQFVELAVMALLDRTRNGYTIEAAYMLREIQTLELLTGRLALSNLSLAEALVGINGSAMRALVQVLTQVPTAKEQLDEGAHHGA